MEKGVRGVGIVHYSIGRMTDAINPVRTILLEANVWIVEELRFPGSVRGAAAVHVHVVAD